MPLVLVNLEGGMELPPAGLPDVRIPMDRDAEASLAVDESDDPRSIERDAGSFLLIVRTGRIVTAHDRTLRRGCDRERVPPDTRRFQHIARF